MTTTLTEIMSIPVDEKELGTVAGKVGEMKMIPVSALRVDGTYQRAMSMSSVRNVRKICAEFDWSKFLPVIVVAIEGGQWSVIDGQHRTTAAHTLGIDLVPCYVLKCSMQDAAAAFAAINGNVTAMNPVDLWFARVAAGDAEAASLVAVMDAADVKVTRKKDGMYVGETRAINVLQRALKAYGDTLLTTILQAITQTSEGNPGMINGAVVNGIGKAIRTKPALINQPTILFDAMDDWSISEAVHEANIESARTNNPVQAILTRMLNEHLREKGVAR